MTNPRRPLQLAEHTTTPRMPESPSAAGRTTSSDVAALPITHGRLLDFPADAARCLQDIHAEHGDIACLQEDDQRLFFVFGPEYNRQVLSDPHAYHSRFFSLRGSKKSAHRRLTSGLLSMNGEEHRQHRGMVMGPFKKQAIPGYRDSVVQLLQELLDGWEVGDTRDFHKELTQHMLRVTSALVFGLDEPALAYRIGGMIDAWVHMNHKAGMGAFISDPELNRNYEQLLELAEELEPEVQTMLDMKRARGAAGSDVLSLLIQAHDETAQLTDEQLIGHLTLMFGAAHLTTAHTLVWTFVMLAQHPEVMQELWREVNESVAGDAPTLAEVEQLPFTEAVIKESMRIMPASAYSQRIAAEPVQLGPFALRRGEPVIFSQFVSHRIESLFPQPRSFQPSRWENLSPSPYAYLPFGNGPRMCIGAPLAMMILKLTLPTMLKRFRIGSVAGSEVNGKILSTMLTPVGTVPMQLHAADGRFSASAITGTIHDLVDLPTTRARDKRKAA